MIIFSRFRLLPLLVIVAALSFTVRVGDFWASRPAFAQHEVQGADVPPLPGDAAAVGEDSEKRDASEEKSLSAEDKPEAEAINWRDAGESEFEYSDVQAGLYKDLALRRKALDAREEQMRTREALLKAGGRELDRKLKEMDSIRHEIEGLLQQQSDEEKARIGSLVKIYEGMKAKDAARIFNTLNMDILITVISSMSERKSAPILAAMNAERARTVTILLARQNQIPSFPAP